MKINQKKFKYKNQKQEYNLKNQLNKMTINKKFNRDKKILLKYFNNKIFNKSNKHNKLQKLIMKEILMRNKFT